MITTNNLGFGNSQTPARIKKNLRNIYRQNNIYPNDPVLTNPNIPVLRVNNDFLTSQPTIPTRLLPPKIGFMGNWGL